MQTRVQQTVDGVSILTLTGDLDANGANTLRQQIDQQPITEHTRIILDCAGVSYASSAGIGTLIRIHRQINEAGGRVLVTGTDGPVFEVLSLMNLGSILELYPDTEAALSALNQTPGG